MKVSKEYKVGILVLIGALLIFQGISLLKNGLFAKDYNEYYAVYNNATGLEVGNEVQLNGIKIGEVLEVKLLPSNPTKVLTKFNIQNKNLKFPTSTVAWLSSVDVLGTMCIDLKYDINDTKSPTIQDGDTLISSHEMTLEDELMAHLNPLKDKTETLVGRVENIIFKINELWDSSASYTFEESIYHAREAIGTYKVLVSALINMVNRESQMASTISVNIDEITENITQKMDRIDKLSTNISSISEDFSSSELFIDVAELNVSMTDLNALIEQINQGEGTLGALMNTEEINQQKEVTEKSMENLLNNMTADPMKYIGLSIFGKKVQGLMLTPEEEKILRDWLAR